MKKIVSLLLALLVLAALPLGAAAEQTGSLTCSYVLPGAAFRLYLVGKTQEDAFVLTGDFAAYEVDLMSDDAAATLTVYAFRDGLTPTAEGITDEAGCVVFEGLQAGVYLLVGQQAVTEEYVYTPQPVLVQVPGWQEDIYEWDRRLEVKYSQEEKQETVEVTVLKLWEGDADTGARPDSVEVQLLKDGEVYDTVTLSRENNWTHTWDELEGGHQWTVAEKDIPENYKLSITGDSNGFVLTNTYDGPGGPGEEELPQTGQLWWPVLLLAGAGMVLVLVGLVRRRGSEDYE